MTTSFSILNSGVVYFTTVVVYTCTYRERSKYGVCACVRRRSNFITAGEEHTRRSENECNSLKDANKQRRRLLHPETHKHEFPTPPPYPSYYCQRTLILLLFLLLILYYIFSVLLLLTRRRLCPTWFAYITPVGIHNFSDIGLTTLYMYIVTPTLKHTRHRRTVTLEWKR